MAEGNPTEFLIENDKKFIGEFIKFMRDNKSQYHITDEEVNNLSSHLDEGANMYDGGYFGVTINMNVALYTAENPFSFDFMEVDNLTKDSRLFNNKVKKFMNSINGDKLDTAPSSPKKKGGMKKRHDIGKKIFKYNPHNKEHPKNKFNIGGRKKKARKKRGGAPKFLCGPDIDFVPEVHFNELESILKNLKKKTDGTALEKMVDKLPSIRKDKGKCIGCKKLIDELVKNTMPSFVGPKILPIKNDDIIWLQQFTGVHKGGMCTVMGGRRNKKTRKKRGGNYIGKVIHLDFNKNKMKEIIINYPDNEKLIQKYYVYHQDANYLYLQDYPATDWKELLLPKKFIEELESKNIIQIQIIPKKVVGGRRRKRKTHKKKNRKRHTKKKTRRRKKR